MRDRYSYSRGTHPREWGKLYAWLGARLPVEEIDQGSNLPLIQVAHYCRTLMPSSRVIGLDEQWTFSVQPDPLEHILGSVIAYKQRTTPPRGRVVMRAVPLDQAGGLLWFLHCAERRAAIPWRLETPEERQFGAQWLADETADLELDPIVYASAMAICLRVAVLQRAIWQRDAAKDVQLWDYDTNDWVGEWDLPPVSVTWETVAESIAEQPDWLTLA